jgi:CBS domain-containing protein
MNVSEIMTKNPACCSPDTPVSEVARMMVEHDCGEIPVVEGSTGKPVGVITDRDITCRTVAMGRNPQNVAARDVMSSPVITVRPDTSLDACCQTMEQHQVRRVPVVDDHERCCGIVAQADIARRAPLEDTADVVREVSRRTGRSSQIRAH